jgi:hypothetical protein
MRNVLLLKRGGEESKELLLLCNNIVLQRFDFSGTGL